MPEQFTIVVLQPSLSRTDHAHNCATIDALLCAAPPRSVIVLPELWWRTSDVAAYATWLQHTAIRTQSLVIGGSLHASNTAWHACLRSAHLSDSIATWRGVANIGAIITPDGNVAAWYGKQHPYGEELARGVAPALGPAVIEWNGARIGAMICADAWDAEMWSACADATAGASGDTNVCAPPSLMCIAAESVSGEHARDDARALWHALAIARAYEFGCGVAIADWAASEHQGDDPTSGAAGFVDPTSADAAFAPCDHAKLCTAFDVTALDTHRKNRAARGFWWWGT